MIQFFVISGIVQEPDVPGRWLLMNEFTPTFLYKLLKKTAIYDVEDIRIGSLALSDLNIKSPNAGSLLFQTGYLTIKNISPNGQVFGLGFPNREVKASFLDGLLSAYRGAPAEDSVAFVDDIQGSLRDGDMH